MLKIKRSFSIILVFIILLSTLVLISFPQKDTDFEYYVEDGYAIITDYLGNSKNLIIPNEIDGYSVTVLEGTFYGNLDIRSVIIPEGIITIGVKTFYGCINLKKVEIPDSVTTLGYQAFAYSGISDIVLGSNIHYIPTECFLGCTQLFTIECKAKAFQDSDVSCYVGSHAFSDTNVKILFNDYNFSFSTYFDGGVLKRYSLGWWLLKIPFARPGLKLMFNHSYFGIIASVLYLLFCCSFIIIIGLLTYRTFLCIIGNDYITNYKTYSKNIYNKIVGKPLHKDIVVYKKYKFKRDDFFFCLRILKYIFVSLAYLSGLLSITSAIIKSFDISMENLFLKACVCLVFIVILTIVLLWGIYKLFCYINEHKKYSDKPHMRIRKIKNGGDKNA